MSKSLRPFRRTFFTFALVSIIGVSFLSIAVAGTSAAGFSIVDSVSALFGLQSESSETADADRGSRAQRIPLDSPLNVYGTGWLRLGALTGESAEANEVDKKGGGSAEDNPLVPKNFDCTTIPSKGIDKMENFRAGAIMIHCGMAQGGSEEEAEEAGGGEPPLAFGATDVNLVTGTETSPHIIQSETFTTANPDNANQVLIGYNDSRGAANNNFSGASYSTDGGATFTRLTAGTGQSPFPNTFGDPVILYNKPTSTWFTIWLDGACGGQGLGGYKSTDPSNPAGWTHFCVHNGGSDDRESGWADNNPSSPFYGRMYISYNDFAVGGGALRVHYTTNNGTTWSAPVSITSGFMRNVQITGDAASGTLYIASMNENGGGFPHNDNNLIFRSTDGGATWTNTYTGPAFPGPGVTAVGYFACMFPDGGGFWRHEGWGEPAVHNGVVSLVYAQHGTGADAGDVYYIRSTDMGATFAAPFKLNSDSTTRPQWQPNISASPTGTLLATWYDARDGTTCTKGNPAVPCYRMYSRKSNDNGATWQPDDTLSDVMSPLPGQSDPNIQGTYAGDYDYGSAILTKHSTAWTDGRNAIGGASQQDTFTDKELVGFAVTTTSPACNSVVSTQPVDFIINLSDPVNVSTVAAGDFTVNGLPASSFTFSNGNATITFHFNTSPVTVQGPQAMHIAAGSMLRQSDGMGIFDFTCSFCYAVTPLQVVSTVPAVGGTFTPPAPGNYNYDINFNQPVDPASVQDSDLMVSGNSGPSVTGHSLLNGNMTVRFTLHMNFGGMLTASLGVGAITANSCNGNAVFTGNYTVEGCPPQNHYSIAQIGGTIVPGTTDTGNHADDTVTTVTLPFSYGLYDQSFTTVSVDSNGKANFPSGTSIFSNTCLPDTGATYSIYPYWDDQRTDAQAGCSVFPGGACGIFTSVTGTAPNRIFNIEWRTVYFATPATSANYELRLYEGQTRFDVVYGLVAGSNTSATAGVQKNNTDFDQYFCNGSGGAATGGQSYTLQGCGTPTPTFTGTPSPTATSTATSTATATPTGSPSCTPGSPSWTSGASMPGVIVRAVGNYFPDNGKFYAMGGRSADTAGSDYTHPFEYDPGSNSWTTKSATYPDNQVNNMACGVLTAAGTPLIYCVGGSAAGATTATARVFAYNPVTDAITTLGAGDNWPGNAAGTILPGGFTVANNKLYILGGFNINVGSINQIWEFDPAQASGSRWLQRVNAPANIMYAPTVTIGGIIYVGGASDYVGGLVTDTTTSFSFNPATNTLGTIATIPRATGETRAVVLNNKMYVLGGGRVAPNPSNEVDIYDPSNNTWSVGLPFVTARRNFPADSDGSHIFLAGGYDAVSGLPIDSMEIFSAGVCGSPSATPTFTPTATTTSSASATPSPSCTPSTWQLGPPQDPARYAFQSALGSDNKLYVAGGGAADNVTFFDQVSRFDPTTNAWSNVAPLPVALSQGTMGAWNGKIYVAGGFLGGTAVTNALQIYDIATNTWSSGPNIPTSPGVEAAAGAVVNGKFYVMGGDDFNNLLNTNFVYDVASNSWSTGATLPDSRTNNYATATGGLIYVFGGLTSLAPLTATDTLLRYDPVANSWANLGSAGTGGHGNYGGISPFGTGQLLITDGADSGYVPSSTSHIFTISGGTFSAGPSMVGTHAGHAQGTLSDGRVLVADGLDTNSTATNTVELLGGPCGTPSATPTFTPTSTATATGTPTATATGSPTCTPGGGNQITTLFASNNNGDLGGANYFDVTVAANPLTVTALDINTDAPGAFSNVQVYVLPGMTSVGNETNPGVWTQVATGSGTGAGIDVATHVTLSSSFVLNPGINGIAVVGDPSGSLYYTNGTGANQTYTNADLTLMLGSATNVPFTAPVFSPRVWNGTIYYSTGGACGTPTATATSTATATATSTSTPTNTPTATPTSTPGTSIQFSSSTYLEDESQVASITITRTGDTSGTDTVTFSTSDGTAMGGAGCTTDVDYISVNQSVTFNPGETSKVVTVSVCADTLTENDQTVNLTLSGTNVGNPSTAVLTINDTASRFRNATGIVINHNAAADPYPATVTVSGGPSVIGSVRVTLYDVAVDMPDNMDVMLVSPGGRAFVLMANAGGTNPNSPATLNFTDTAGQVIPDNGPLVTADYEPTSYGSVAAFPPPAPTSFNLPGSTVGGTGTETLFGNFGGTNSNGVWSLYVRDDSLTEGGVVGNIAGGWGIEFLGTTAANASLAGRVTTADGRPIRNAEVVITGNALEHPITVATGSLGWFTFDGLPTGETYVVTVNSRRFTFSTPSRVITLVDNVANIDFVANPQ